MFTQLTFFSFKGMRHVGVKALTILILGAIGFSAVACVPPSPATPSPLNACVNFEDLKVGNSYKVSDTFTDSGVTSVVMPFQWSSGLGG